MRFGEITVRIEPGRGRKFRQTTPGDLEITYAGAEAGVCASIQMMGAAAALTINDPGHA